MRRVLIILLLGLVACVVLFAYLQKRPFYKGRSLVWHWAPDLTSENVVVRETAVTTLRDALREADPDVRKAACSGVMLYAPLAGKGVALLVPEIVALLKDNDPEIRRRAVTALRRLGPDVQGRMCGLVLATDHEDSEVRERAELGLHDYGPEAVIALPELLDAARTFPARFRPVIVETIKRIDPKSLELIERNDDQQRR